MTEWIPLHLDASRPEHWLISLGLLAALPQTATMCFDEQNHPHVVADLTTDQAVETILTVLYETLNDQDLPWGEPGDPGANTVAPTWRFLEPLGRQAATTPRIDRLLHTVDVGVPRRITNSQARGKAGQAYRTQASELLLISGKMHIGATLKNLWSIHRSHPGFLAAELTQLLDPTHHHGEVHRTDEVKGFRYTAIDVSPRLRGGNPNTSIAPASELLAFLAVTCLLPRQRGIDPTTGNLVAGLTWALPPTPVPLSTLIALHEARLYPPGWRHYTCIKRKVNDEGNLTAFTHTRALQEHR